MKYQQTVVINNDVLTKFSNECFVNGTIFGSRKQITQMMLKAFAFRGGYRAAYRLVKTNFTACDTYFGKMENGRYGINCWFCYCD